jgi:dephospho-CoA kinase
MTKIIGLTGGIGSGLIANHFQSLESRLYERRSTKNATPDVIDAIKETFGTTLLKVLF